MLFIQKRPTSFHTNWERRTNMNSKATSQQRLRERRPRSRPYTCERWRSLRPYQHVKWFSG